MAHIYDNFKDRDEAERFARDVRTHFGHRVDIFDSQEELDKALPQFAIHPPVVCIRFNDEMQALLDNLAGITS